MRLLTGLRRRRSSPVSALPAAGWAYPAVSPVCLIAMLITGCAVDGHTPRPPAVEGHDAGTPSEASEGVAHLSPLQHLTRASMALRGLRPTLAELEAVREDPNQLGPIVNYYLESDEFGQTIRELHEQALLVGVDAILYPAGFVPQGQLSDLDSQTLNRSIVEAPLRLIEHVVMQDRPYTEIVTADYGLADRVVATVWGMEYDRVRAGAGEIWQESQYADHRPIAGILSDGFLFTRHSSTVSNKGRGRANAVARALLCYDFLSREIPLDAGIDLADPDAVADAVTSNPACVSCHQTLDPLAAYFSSYRPTYVPTQETSFPVAFVREGYAALLAPAEPNYFGVVGGDIEVLGTMISQDPRFSACAARRFFGYFAQVAPESVPLALVSQLQGVLIDSGMSAKALAKAVVFSEAFTAAGVSGQPHEMEEGQAAVGLLRARPRQVARSVEELTGYRWRTRLAVGIGTGQIGELDLMYDAFFGFKVLAGGIDSQHVTRPSHTMTATTSLTFENLAARAAAHVIQKDRAIEDPSRRWLLTEVDPDSTDEQAVKAQLAALQLRLFGELAAPGDTAVDQAYQLFSGVLGAAGGTPQRAWSTTLYAMFQEPRFVFF